MEITFYKKADKDKNRIIIPKFYIEKNGREFYMKIKKNGDIILKPYKKKGE